MTLEKRKSVNVWHFCWNCTKKSIIVCLYDAFRLIDLCNLQSKTRCSIYKQRKERSLQSYSSKTCNKERFGVFWFDGLVQNSSGHKMFISAVIHVNRNCSGHLSLFLRLSVHEVTRQFPLCNSFLWSNANSDVNMRSDLQSGSQPFLLSFYKCTMKLG